MDWLTAILVWLSVDPVITDVSAARAAAGVECAYASMARPVAREEGAKQATPAVRVGGKPVANCPTGNCPLPRR